MKTSRRLFLAAFLFPRTTQTKPLEVEVMETFEIEGRTSAVLAHHADPLSRDRLADWLRSHPKSTVRVQSKTGLDTTANVFRVRMCFGRALILLKESWPIRERDILRIAQ